MRRLIIQPPTFFKVGGIVTDELVYDGVLISIAFEDLLKENNIISRNEVIYDFVVEPLILVPGGTITCEFVYRDDLMVFTVLEVQQLNY